tara:strand:- start:1645 stop:2091 length:447 start_codon:yes stop_codon:yes gene_type:complete
VEPITAAVAAFSAVKKGIQVGKDLHDMAGDIGKLWGGIDAARGAHTKKKKGQIISVEEEALQTFAAKRKADEIEKELREFIIYTLGGQAWSQLIEIRGQVRKRRLEEAAKARRQKRKAIEMGILTVVIIIAFSALWYMGYIVITQGNF